MDTYNMRLLLLSRKIQVDRLVLGFARGKRFASKDMRALEEDRFVSFAYGEVCGQHEQCLRWSTCHRSPYSLLLQHLEKLLWRRRAHISIA